MQFFLLVPKIRTIVKVEITISVKKFNFCKVYKTSFPGVAIEIFTAGEGLDPKLSIDVYFMMKGYYRLRGDFGPCLQPQPGAATVCIEVLSTFKESFKPLVTPHIEKNGKA